MHSITARITGLVFISILLTVVVLISLANYQMDHHFGEYLAAQREGTLASGIMGTAEKTFLENIHRSLYWVGAVILLVGLSSSYWLARSITIPIRNLGEALASIEKGHLGQTVAIDSRSEVGRLAGGFNRMSLALSEQTKLRRRLLADLAHELRTPLAVIQGNLEGMLDGVVERNDENLNSLLQETESLGRLITDLRDLSLAEAKQLRLDKELTDINLLIQRAVNMLEPLALERGLSLKTQLSMLPPVLLDSRRINQVLYNLLTNALRFTPNNGNIQIRTSLAHRQNKAWLQVDVEDNGCGISAEDLPFVFEHFYRSDASRDKKSGGSGIGLAIVKQLVELHDGQVDVWSKPGQGSCFSVLLPIN